MTPAASALAEQHVNLARMIAARHRWRFPDDPETAEGVALEALCHAANATDPDRVGSFGAFLTTVIERRMIDEQRRRYGRYVQSARRARHRERSLDTRVSDDQPDTFADLLPAADPDGPYRLVDLVDVVDRGGLTDRERAAVLATGAGWRLADVADVLGVTEARVCQIRRDARRKLAATA